MTAGRIILAGAAAVLAACANAQHAPGTAAAPGVEQDINAARNSGPTPSADTSADLLRNPVPPAPAPQPFKPSVSPPVTSVPDTHATPGPGDVHAGRRFALANCQPCHVVTENHGSQIRFADAPSFHAVADMPSTTSLSLNIWLRNPHPTMPSLMLSRQEAADVVAYILSLRSAH